ncbi:DUF1015 family protein [Flavobacteriaceae bacterium]|jgi:uncharacterized protein (DUF1015 family)|nr:DUF1015 family protein [Flavobacteriaceae bacterium]MDC1051799.1 DUF1015 family protein [Flavobacteriaceae bacterium]MDC3181372.1 DUF1015 family protein [Flavobacteriaceae bacterium]
MSIFVPFKAYRPQQKYAQNIASKPYDVLNAKEAKLEALNNPISFYNVIKPEINFSEDSNYYAPRVYEKGKAVFDDFVSKNILKQDSHESYYVYELTMGNHTQTGLVGCCSIDDYFNNTIKKHELTRPDKEEDRKNHVRYSALNYEAVFLSYPQVTGIDQLVNITKKEKHLYDFISDDDIRHRLWAITNKEILRKITALFKTKVPKIYIADGHHRTAAGALVGKEFRDSRNGNLDDKKRDNYFMAVVFPDNQLKILDYNRVVKDLNGFTKNELIQRLKNKFDVVTCATQYRPESLHTFGMYLEGQWYKLSSLPDSYDDSDPIGQLDVTILSKNVLEPIFDIIDLRKDIRIDFVGGMRGLSELEKRVDSGDMKVAFSMYPVSMTQLINISDNDLLMPPKVTWFEPKLRSGLFIHDLTD